MTSPDERIKMAEELRAYVDGLGGRIDSADIVETILLGTIRYRDDDGTLYLPTSHASLIAMLADLIEPQDRTCRNMYSGHGDRSFLCNACGYEAWTYDDSCCDPDEFEFCPNCGARVVDE